MIGGNKQIKIQAAQDPRKLQVNQGLPKEKSHHDSESHIKKKLGKLAAKYPVRFKLLKPVVAEDKENPLRLYKLLKRIKAIKNAQQIDEYKPKDAFRIILESDQLNIHEAALLALLPGKADAVHDVVKRYPALLKSQYLQYIKPFIEKAENPVDPESIAKIKFMFDSKQKPAEDCFGETDIFISLNDVGLSKDNVYVVDCLDCSRVAKGLAELTKEIKTTFYLISGKTHKFSYLTIASWQRIYIFDLSGLYGASQDSVLEEIRRASINEFKSHLLKFLKNGQVLKILLAAGAFKKFFREHLSDSPDELKQVANIVDLRVTMIDLLNESEKGKSMEFKVIKSKVFSKYYEYVEAIYSRPFSHAAAASDWDMRPISLYQQHYMALYSILALPVLERLEKENVNYVKFKTYKELNLALKEIKSKFINTKPSKHKKHGHP